MQFQKVHVSIVRSIRHVSLVRDWHRARGTRQLPQFSDFVPNERAGDSADLSISDIVREDGKLGGYGGGLWRKQRLLDLEKGVRGLLE